MTESAYPLQDRKLIAESAGLRVQVLTIGPGQSVPWHHHTDITDTFFCLAGPMVVETRSPDARHTLVAGEELAIPPGVAHHVHGVDEGRCRFAIVQGVGTYDYVPAE